jgi:hypothetical protein
MRLPETVSSKECSDVEDPLHGRDIPEQCANARNQSSRDAIRRRPNNHNFYVLSHPAHSQQTRKRSVHSTRFSWIAWTIDPEIPASAPVSWSSVSDNFLGKCDCLILLTSPSIPK